ncbi:hypothetical protein GCM10027053_47780 [Intrasporangium mesophilum]
MTHAPDRDKQAAGLLEELLWLARDAQQSIDHHSVGRMSDDAEYAVGERDTYVAAVAFVASARTREEAVFVARRVIGALIDGVTDLGSLTDLALGRKPAVEQTRELDVLDRRPELPIDQVARLVAAHREPPAHVNVRSAHAHLGAAAPVAEL